MTHDVYYAPGETVTILENTVFYADWMASTYDIGQYNAHVANTVSTNAFITTRMFDYNYLFNVLSADSTGSISGSSHSESWSIVQGENVDYQNRKTLDFIFLDYGNGGTLDYPNNRRDGVNQYPGEGIVTGGIHQAESGEINFFTGEVLIQGERNNTLSNYIASLEPGEHTLTMMYLERGAAHSNCAIYFNLAPRFRVDIQKEDVLTRDVLNGAQFSVFQDLECTVPVELWPSEESYLRGDPGTNVFTVEKGSAHMWGMGAGNTYYIKETRPPDRPVPAAVSFRQQLLELQDPDRGHHQL